MFETAIWDYWATRYERLYAQHFVLAPSRHLLLEHLQIASPHPRRMLDLGCGIGQLAAELADRFPAAHITAVDPAPKMIARARKVNARENVTYIHGVLDELSDNDPFDVIVSTHAFPYIADKPTAMRGMYDLLRPGGKIIIVQANTQNFYDRLVLLFVKLTVSKCAYLSTKVLGAMMADAGLVPGNVTPLPRPWFFPSIFLLQGVKEHS